MFCSIYISVVVFFYFFCFFVFYYYYYVAINNHSMHAMNSACAIFRYCATFSTLPSTQQGRANTDADTTQTRAFKCLSCECMREVFTMYWYANLHTCTRVHIVGSASHTINYIPTTTMAALFDFPQLVFFRKSRDAVLLLH